MLRFERKSPALLAALVLVAGSGTLSAGVWDFWKAPAKKPAAKASRKLVARGQEPSPAPPTAVDVAPDPGYSPPAPEIQAAPATPSPEHLAPAPISADCSPQYAGFSSAGAAPYCMGHACTECRDYGWFGINLSKSSARMHGDSYYCDCLPLDGPRYGYYETCWRRLPEDCRCPIYLPPRKSQITTPEPEESKPAGEVIPPPPQVLNFR